MAARELATALITLDTSGVFALLNRRDPGHQRARDALASSKRPYLIPCATLAEIGYLLERRMPNALDPFLADLESGAFTLHCEDEDVARIRHLVVRYADLPLGVGDAAVIACSERSGRTVLTFDRRDFEVVAREGTIDVIPMNEG